MADTKNTALPATPRGIVLTAPTRADCTREARVLFEHLETLGLGPMLHERALSANGAGGGAVSSGDAASGDASARGAHDDAVSHAITLASEAFERLTPDFDTLDLHARLGTDRQPTGGELARETMISLLASPIAYRFPSAAEAISASRIRIDTALAGRETALAFTTEAAERPWDYWQYAETTGFTLNEGAPLIPALQAATQPARTGQLYSFSCYRASEYVMLLGIAQELERCNPALLDRLSARWRAKAIQSGQFHDVFLREHGSQTTPFAFGHYVPGDRVWFRNPDRASADVEGYEGSWVVYLGGGLFTNFWKRDAPFTFDGKCLEIHHWRHAVVPGTNGKPTIDESIVEARVAATLEDPEAVARILPLMQRYRDPTGTWGDGGCIDSTRESARWVCPGTADLEIPFA